MLDPVEPEFGQKAGIFSLIRSLAAILKIAQTAVASGVPLLEHDPEKWKTGFPKSMPSGLTRGIMLKQRDEIMIRFRLIGS